MPSDRLICPGAVRLMTPAAQLGDLPHRLLPSSSQLTPLSVSGSRGDSWRAAVQTLQSESSPAPTPSGRHPARCGFLGGDMPAVCARDANNSKLVTEGEFPMGALQEFVCEFTAGRLEPCLESEPAPETTDGAGTVAVSRKSGDVVTNNGKDTPIEFYAPWCGHCRELAPIFDGLGTRMKDEDVAIVKWTPPPTTRRRLSRCEASPPSSDCPRTARTSPSRTREVVS